uniref:WD repeat and HMG-box DNA-binding protein 1 n=1 Tax=Neovison vison TaxID=452646 RepID=A0A8C7EKM2_NEOVI
MPATQKPMRFGHTEGHTDVCFDDLGSYIVTCGSDGDVRIWEDLDDDDPKSINVGEKAYSCALKNGKLVTAVSNNTIQVHTFPEGVPDGILTRFTTNANHVVFNGDGGKVAAGSSDFLLKVVDVMDCSQQKTFRGHDAPVLSLSFDPKDIFLASASCDGSVKVWQISDQTCTISWPLLQKCNDVINAKSICRLAWQPKSGKLLAVPVEKSVKLYRRETWNNQYDLSDNFISQALNIVTWSPCGQYLAAGSINGLIIVWNVETKECMERVKHEKGYAICGLAWHPTCGRIAYTDAEGNLGLLENVCEPSGKISSSKVSSKVEKDYNDLFDGDDANNAGDFLNDNAVETPSFSKRIINDEEEDDDLMLASGRPRQRSHILEDDDNSPVEILLDKEEEDDQANSIHNLPLVTSQRSFYDGPMPTPRQKPFQSGSTPMHLTHRFMVWNSVGIIRCYNDEQDNAIDVEFHDTSIHHATHLSNTLNYTVADLSYEAILLACESTDELPSKLHCLHFSSWDSSKEWLVDMPQNEDIEAICLGLGWAAAATSAMLLRLFTIGGVQKEIFSLPGPIVSMAGHGEQLFIVYHRGAGFDGDQCLGVQLLELGKKKKQILHGDPLPLTRKSYLVWVGFSAEGTPCYVDSEGVVRMLNRGLGNTWTPICNTREHCKGKSDHYWVLSCKLDREFRCMELADLMTQNAVNLAIKYASRSRRLILAQRLSELAVEKAAELAATQVEEEEEEDFRKELNAGSEVFYVLPLLSEGFFLTKGAVTCSNQGRVNPFKVNSFHTLNCILSIKFFSHNCYFRPKTGFQMWLEENRSSILSDNPNFSDEADIIKEGMMRFRVLSAEERKAWAAKAKGGTTSDGAEAKKRKHVVDESYETENEKEKAKENLNLPKKQKPLDLSTNQKLSAFAFKQE